MFIAPNPPLGNPLTSGDASVNYSPILNIAKYKELEKLHKSLSQQDSIILQHRQNNEVVARELTFSLAVSIMLLTEKPHSHSKYSVAGAMQPWASNESKAETKQKKIFALFGCYKRTSKLPLLNFIETAKAIIKGFQMFQTRHCGSRMKSGKSSAGVLGQNEIED